MFYMIVWVCFYDNIWKATSDSNQTPPNFYFIIILIFSAFYGEMQYHCSLYQFFLYKDEWMPDIFIVI